MSNMRTGSVKLGQLDAGEMKFNPKPEMHPMDIPREVIEKCFVIVASGTNAAAVLSASQRFD
jgi:hypothetical protein